MKRGSLLIAVCLVVWGCGDDEPEDGSSTAATTVANPATSDATSTTEAEPSTSTGAEDDSSGAEESSSTGTLLEVVYADDIQPLWNANCTCHLMGSSGTMTAPVLTLNPDVSYGELVGVPSEQSELARVVSDELEASYLWRKVAQTHAEVGDGTEMPPGNPLDEADLNVIRSWILTGAQP